MFLDRYLPADGFIAATPIYWYGSSAQLKAFFDRTFCYYAASYPRSEEVIKGMQGKRIGLVLSSEETFPMVSGAVICQIQEFSATRARPSSASCMATAMPGATSCAIRASR